MKINIEVLVPALECFKSARNTQGLQTDKFTPNIDTWIDWLHAEHTQIRVMQLRINILDIPYYIAMHLRTHDKGVIPFVRSQRETALKPIGYDRTKAPQDALVSYCPVLNPQSLINISRRRLCAKADIETIGVWKAVKETVKGDDNPYVAAIAEVMQPYCIYRGGICHEVSSCGLCAHWRDL